MSPALAEDLGFSTTKADDGNLCAVLRRVLNSSSSSFDRELPGQDLWPQGFTNGSGNLHVW